MSNRYQHTKWDFSLIVPTIKDFSLRYYYDDKTDVRQARIFPPHVHGEVEIYVLIDGDVSFMVENTVYKLTAGDVILTRPNEIHNCILNSHSVHKHICLWLSCQSELLYQPLLEHEFGKGNLVTADDAKKAGMLANLRRLIEASERNDRLSEFACGVELIRYVVENLGKSGSVDVLPELLSNVLSDVNANFNSITSINQLCERNYISHSTLCRLFKKHLHTSPGMYLESKRLAHSRKLLLEGKSVMQACGLSGFSDYSNYIRLFKKRFGITPNKYINK